MNMIVAIKFMEKVKILIKPIQFQEIKEEIEIEIDKGKNLKDLISEINTKKPEIGKSILFMFRGKKLLIDKSLEEQGIKEGSKLMMQKSNEIVSEPIEKSKEEIKITARNKLM